MPKSLEELGIGAKESECPHNWAKTRKSVSFLNLNAPEYAIFEIKKTCFVSLMSQWVIVLVICLPTEHLGAFLIELEFGSVFKERGKPEYPLGARERTDQQQIQPGYVENQHWTDYELGLGFEFGLGWGLEVKVKVCVYVRVRVRWLIYAQFSPYSVTLNVFS